MEINKTLLVALMFVTILSIGIGTVLMGLATIVDKRSNFKTYWVHNSWIILLLLTYFNLFWQVTDVFSIEDWFFRDFLYVIAGPTLLVFATAILLPSPDSGESSDLRHHYFGISGQFFLLIALTQLWASGTDLVLRRGFTTGGMFDLVALGLALVLVFSREPRIHGVITVVFWLQLITAIVLRGTGIL